MTQIDFNRLGHNYEENLTSKMLPTIWCSGCSLGTNLQSLVRGALSANFDLDKELVLV